MLLLCASALISPFMWPPSRNGQNPCHHERGLEVDTFKPTLVITGTDDNFYQPHVNSLKIAEKIPGAWLVQIKNAGHAEMPRRRRI